MNVSYEGIGCQTVTVPTGNCVAGQVCKIGVLGKAEKCSDGEAFCGVVVSAEKLNAAVQIEGFVEVSYTGSIPARGYTKLSCNGAGGVKVDTAGKEYLVVAVDHVAAKVTIKL